MESYLLLICVKIDIGPLEGGNEVQHSNIVQGQEF